MLIQPLRERQDWTLQECRRACFEGDWRPVVQGPTGFGKTALAAHLAWNAVEKGKTVTFSVPAIALINQTDRIFQRFGIPADKIGVIQARHERTNHKAPIQIASVQTLLRRGEIPETDVWMVDECHKWFREYAKWFSAPIWEKKPIIGLSATPWTVGLGKYYGRLIRPATIRQLIDENLLADYDYFAPSSPRTDDLPIDSKTRDFKSGPAGQRMSETKLMADVVGTWRLLWGKPWTLCFAQNRAHAALLLTQFSDAGFSCGYMDAFTPDEEREETLRLYREKKIDILVNVGVLILGVDEPCDCLILAMLTWSEMKYVQICGRGIRAGESQRIIDGKKRLLVLDHGDNWARLNAFDQINYETLHDGEKAPRKTPSIKLPKPCVKCGFIPPKPARQCTNCGHVVVVQSSVKNEAGDLVQVNGKKIAEDKLKAEKMVRFYVDLLCIERQRGWNKYAIGKQFKERYGVPAPSSWRKRYDKLIPAEPCDDTKWYLKRKWAAYYSKINGAKTVDGPR